MEEGISYDTLGEVFRIRVTEPGRVVIPAAIRERLGIRPGTEIMVTVDEQGIRLQPLALAMERAQDYFSSLGPSESLASGELIRERRMEANDEGA